MSIQIRIEKSEQIILIDDDKDISLGELKLRVADALGVGVDELESVHIDLGYNRKNIEISPRNEAVTLRDGYNVQSRGNPVHVRVKIKPELTQESSHAIADAKQDFVRAIINAQDAQAHVIITVGSYLNIKHPDYDESLLRQQFPIKHLGSIHEDDPIHLIHIDPGFLESRPDVPQLYETRDWNLVCKNGDVVNTYRHHLKPYTMTTIAVPIIDRDECESYFGTDVRVSTILGVDLLKYLLRAEINGTGFVTGNFYNPGSSPVLSVRSRNDDLNENVDTNQNIQL